MPVAIDDGVLLGMQCDTSARACVVATAWLTVRKSSRAAKTPRPAHRSAIVSGRSDPTISYNNCPDLASFTIGSSGSGGSNPEKVLIECRPHCSSRLHTRV
ncbi:hypothetical protein SEA_NORVS_144 [Gordonia phage Norvs]|nr:hypothetical protein SEA_NORVS_144 [Gordonia phage Norvs]